MPHWQLLSGSRGQTLAWVTRLHFRGSEVSSPSHKGTASSASFKSWARAKGQFPSPPLTETLRFREPSVGSTNRKSEGQAQGSRTWSLQRFILNHLSLSSFRWLLPRGHWSFPARRICMRTFTVHTPELARPAFHCVGSQKSLPHGEQSRGHEEFNYSRFYMT